ncbi:Structural maintenance of chromosomes protein 6 [Astathelohania contejeani]|uniref:Structural maintenance of chromosomes protein 6 n=1 Tax=Astathelohania contejeani TaxID=164912 RepID=A0ABQ7HYH3_9MICR|nr:Structural maintenance of chromosomes protein 6 [Thelohania contejeani]
MTSDIDIRKPTIQSIELINFMCHKHLFIEFKKLLTCIGGRNGSGKSAIMIALGLALGQRAQSLERGNSFRELIKSGQEQALIRVKLRNNNRFCYDFFGDFIIVEKRLRRESSTLSIFNEQRRLYSSRRDDLIHILDFLSLRLDNPLNFLTQEQAKKFLNVTRPDQLYRFFLKGTEIEDMVLLHEEAQGNASQMKEMLEKISKELEELNENLRLKNEKLEILSNISKFEKEILKLEAEKKWSVVCNEKRNLDEIEEYVLTESENLKSLETEFQECSAQLIRLQTENKENTERINQRKKENETRIFECKKTIENIQLQEREISNDLEELEEVLLGLINNQKELNKLNNVDFIQQTKLLKENLSHKLNDLIKQAEEIKSERESLTVAIEEKSKEITKYTQEKKAYDDKIFALKKQVNYYAGLRNNLTNYFSDRMGAVLNDIKHTRFNQRVIGPLGLHIKLKEHRWYKAISQILNNVLNNFIVFDKRDRELLNSIFKKYSVSFPILLPSSSIKTDLIKYEDNKNYITALSVIEVDDNVIMNQLIILTGLEQIILISDRDEAYRVIRSKPKNVDCVYLISGDRIKLIGGSLSDYRPKNMDKFYFENTGSKYDEIKAELERMIKFPPTGPYEAQNILRLLHKNLEELNSKLDSFSREERRINSELDGLKENENNKYEKDVLEADLERINEEIEQLKIQKNDLIKSRNQMMQQIDSLKEEVILRENEKFDLSTNASQINELNKKLNLLNNRCVLTKHRLEDKQIKLNTMIKKWEELKESVYKETGIKMESTRSNDIINEEIAILTAKINQSRAVGDEGAIKSGVDALKTLKKNKEKLISLYKSKIEDLIKTMDERIKKREKIKIEVSNQSKKEFKRLAALRGYIGELDFKHEEGILDLKLKVTGSTEGGNKGTLSGGERSFAGVCFLLSLWPFLGCPVKILDEFDVYMDTMNRKCTIEMIIDFFVKNQLQVILITPLNTEDLFNNNCEVIVLEPPKRD